MLFSTTCPAQVLFTASKKKFKLAVERNSIKRLLREGYRKNKHELYDVLNAKQKYLALGFIYTGKQVLPYQDLEQKIKAVIMRLKQEIEGMEDKSSHQEEP
jgi:ribonuclease P protein component